MRKPLFILLLAVLASASIAQSSEFSVVLRPDGTGDEFTTAGSAVDAAGNVYFAGQTRATAAAAPDFFVTKLTRNRKHVYTKSLGGSGVESNASLAVDVLGNVYVVGTTASTDFPLARAMRSSPAGESSAVLFKLDAAGDVIYATYLGAASAKSVGVDAAGSPFVLLESGRVMKLRADAGAVEYEWAGDFRASVMAVDAQGGVTVAGEADSIAVAKLAPYSGDEVRVLASARVGSALDKVTGIAVDASGFVYLTGETGADGFAMRLNDSLSKVLYNTRIGGSKADHPASITVDQFGIATAVGITESADLEQINGIEGASAAENGSTGFIARLGAGGEVLNESYLPAGRIAVDAAADAFGGIWLAGSVMARFEPGADGAILLSHAASIRPGRSGARFSVRSLNTGSEQLGDRVVTIGDAGEGVEIVGLSGAGWMCEASTCRRADPLDPGHEDPVITVLAKVAGTVSGDRQLSATLAAAGDSIAQNSAATDQFRVTQGPDAVIQKVHFGTFSQGQNGATYLIRVTNNGTQPTTGTVTVTDTLPQGLTLVSMAGNGWTCAANTCSRQDVLAPDQTYPQITVTVNVATDAAASVANTASVSGGGDADTANNTAIDATSIRGPDLRVTKTHSQNFLPGQQGAQYTITVSNIGASASRGTVTVTDVIPTGLTLVAMSGNGWNCVQAVCTRGDALAPNASYPAINVAVNVDANAPTTVTNVASVSGGGDTDASNNAASDITSVQPGVDLRITKTHVSGNRRNATISFDLAVTNIGTVATTGTVTVSDTLPSSLVLSAMSGNGWNCAGATCSRNDALAAGASYPTIRVDATSSATAPPSVTNIAAVFADNDIASANNVATAPVNLSYSDLTISKTHTGNLVRGLKGRFTIVVSNNGSAATTDPTAVTDTLPAGLTLSSAGGPGWTCVVNVCTSTDPVAPGASLAPLTVIADVAANAPASVTNTATVTGTDDTFSNNTASDTATVSDSTDLTITKVHEGTQFLRGQQGTYTIRVTNSGGAFTSGVVTVIDTLPAGLTLVNMQGAGWTCVSNTCTRSDILAQNQNFQPITVTAAVNNDAGLQLVNTATVYGGGDANSANNTATDTVNVGTADLTITKTHSGNFFRGQQGANYDITVTNVGVVPTLGTVTVTDTLPTGLSLFSAIGSGWTCVQTTCTRTDSLAPNASYPPLRIRVNAAPDAPSQVINVATVFGGNDPKTGNNTTSDPTTIDATGTGGPASPDILSPAPGQVIPTGGVTFQWSAIGNATGYDLRISDAQTSRVIFTGVLAGSASTQTLVSLPNGTFIFRVRSCVNNAFNDANCGAFSSQSFTIAATGPTAAPTATAPTANQTINASTITFSWTAVTGATAYELQVFDASNGQSEMQTRVSAPSTSVIYSMRTGTFDMLVRACTQLCGPWSTARRFNMVLGPVPTVAPEITVATFADNSITVGWLNLVGADLFRILVVQPNTGPGGGALTVASRRVSSNPANFQVPSGTARVYVAGCNGDGCGPFAISSPINPIAAQPPQPILASPEPGSVQNGPVVFFAWNRTPGDNGSNTLYRLYVQDQARQTAALDIVTRNNFFAANFRAEGARYDALVIANPDTPIAVQGPPNGFTVKGSSPTAPTSVAPRHQGTTQAGNVQLAWTPVPGATLYEYYVAGPSNPTVRGVTPGLLVQAPLAAVNGQPTQYQMIVRACPAGATCTSGSDAGWGPWSSDVTGAITFTVTP